MQDILLVAHFTFPFSISFLTSGMEHAAMFLSKKGYLFDPLNQATIVALTKTHCFISTNEFIDIISARHIRRPIIYEGLPSSFFVANDKSETIIFWSSRARLSPSPQIRKQRFPHFRHSDSPFALPT